DDAGRLIELFYAFECGVGIGDVVVRQFLALQLLRGTDAGFVQIFFRVERGKLVRVFAVAHFLFFVQLQIEGAREQRAAAVNAAAEIICDSAVVRSGVFVGLDRQIEARV